jgi:hypothetical protein
MSIDDEIASHVSAGRLFCLPSQITGVETVRTMYVSQDIFYAVAGPFTDDHEGERLAEFRQTLDAFLEGAEFSVAEDPYVKPSDAMLPRVAPVSAEIWDIRVIAPNPGIRVLGGFSKLDTFVALTWDYRENLDGPRLWNDEIDRCRKAWRDLFGTKQPLKGKSLDDYLTNFYAV